MKQNAGAYDREMNNIGDKPTIFAAFQREWIDYMIENPYRSIASVKYLFVTIDPSACKDRNCYVVTSMIFVNGRCIVCNSNHSISYPYSYTLINHI